MKNQKKNWLVVAVCLLSTISCKKKSNLIECQDAIPIAKTSKVDPYLGKYKVICSESIDVWRNGIFSWIDSTFSNFNIEDELELIKVSDSSVTFSFDSILNGRQYHPNLVRNGYPNIFYWSNNIPTNATFNFEDKGKIDRFPMGFASFNDDRLVNDTSKREMKFNAVVSSPYTINQKDISITINCICEQI